MRTRALGEIDIFGQRVADHFRLLGDFLGHEMAVIALVDQHRGGLGKAHRPDDLAVFGIEDFDRAAGQHHPVAVLEIGDAVGEGRERDGIRAQKHFALAVADRQRAALARADQQIVLALEHDGEREGAFEPLEHVAHRLARRLALGPLCAMRWATTSVSVWVANSAPAGHELILQFTEILDDAVVHDDHVARHVRMGIGFVGGAMGGPARMADAGWCPSSGRPSASPRDCASLPGARLRRSCRSRWWRCRPNRSPGIPAASAPRRCHGATGSRPRIPTIPHMHRSPFPLAALRAFFIAR